MESWLIIWEPNEHYIDVLPLGYVGFLRELCDFPPLGKEWFFMCSIMPVLNLPLRLLYMCLVLSLGFSPDGLLLEFKAFRYW